MWVTIAATKYGKCPEYQGASLLVPATRAAVQDAMERARVPEGGAYRLLNFEGWPDFLRQRLSRIEADIREVNVLAGLVDRMDREQLSWYEGVLGCIETEHGDYECSIKDLINATENLGYFEFLPGIVRDRDLGENAVDGELVGFMREIPEEAFPFLDIEKVGAYVRGLEKGVFTKEGYCFRMKEGWMELYDGQNLPEAEAEPGGPVSIKLQNWECPEHGEIWLSLPCGGERIASVCSSLQAESLNRCRITEVSSAVPVLEQEIRSYEDMEVLNELAGKLKGMSANDLVKYKAVLAFDGWKSVERALWLADRLECYVFDPGQVSYADYGRECLKNLGVDCQDPAFLDFSFTDYGKRQYEAAGMKKTAYGAVSLDRELDFLEAQDDMSQMESCGCQTM